jgi:hypothetical protein
LTSLLLAMLPGLLDRQLLQKGFAFVVLKLEDVYKSRAVPAKKVE